MRQFTLHEAAAAAGTSYRTAARIASGGCGYGLLGSAPARSGRGGFHGGGGVLLSEKQAGEIATVSLLRGAGVPMQRIRRAAAGLRRDGFNPLSSASGQFEATVEGGIVRVHVSGGTMRAELLVREGSSVRRQRLLFAPGVRGKA